MKKEKAVASFTWHSNLRFVLERIWQWDRTLLSCVLLFALCSVLSPYIAIFLPMQLIDTLSRAKGSDLWLFLSEILRIVSALAAILLLSNVGQVASRRLVRDKGVLNRSRLIHLSDVKAASIEYWIAESSKGQLARYKSGAAIGGNDSGGEAIVVHGANLLAHGSGLLLYCFLLSNVNPMLIALLMAAEICGALGLQLAQNFEHKQADIKAEIERKRRSVEIRSTDYSFAKDIRLFGMGEWLSQSHLRFIDAALDVQKMIQKRYFLTGVARTVFVAVRDFIAYSFLTSQVVQGNLTAGEFTLQFAAIAGISNWLNLLAQDVVLVNRALLQIDYLRAYLELPDTVTTPPGRTSDLKLPEGSFSVVFDRVSFHYPGNDTDTLKDFSLSIACGEKVALVGLNGAGKTTCVKLLTGLYRPTSGRILIGGLDSQLFSSKELFALFGVVFQESRLLAVDIRQNVALRLEEEIDDEKVVHCLELAGLKEKVESLPDGIAAQLTKALYSEGVELSGGENQKLMLARALYKEAPFLVLDEPTAALDPLAEHEVYQRYAELTGGRSSLYISHRLASTRFCDRIAFLSEGRVVELGSHEELLRLGGGYAHLFELQSQYYQSQEVVSDE